MNPWIAWTILVVSLVTLGYNITSNYAIRGNELKHLKEAIKCLEEKLLKRIERLENMFLKKGE